MLEGIVVISLLPKPSTATKISSSVKTLPAFSASDSDIDNIIEQIADNVRNVKALLRKRVRRIARLQAKLDLYRMSAKSMTSEEVESVSKFFAQDRARIAQVNDLIDVALDDEYLEDIKLAILRPAVDKSLVFYYFIRIFEMLTDAAAILKNLIALSDRVLSAV
jgi:ABC-type transporter Mla subunit MlaD